MGELVVAIRAVQALIVPSVIIATVVNESKPDQLIAIRLDDVDALKAGKDVVIELTLGGAAPVRGGEAAIKELLKHYPSLYGKQSELVCLQEPDAHTVLTSNHRKMNGSTRSPTSTLLILRLWIRTSSSSTPILLYDLILWGTFSQWQI
jgi:hypothetical protein